MIETVTPVNDQPSFSISLSNINRNEDAGPQAILGFATDINPGGPEESGQQLTFIVDVYDESLFSATPVISAMGALSFTPAPNANGPNSSRIANATVYMMDDGGVANCGIDTSTSAFFAITILPVNDAPSFTLAADQFVLEDDPQQVIPNFATGISAWPIDESTQVLNFITSTSNDALFSATPILDTTGTLSYTPASNANGSATVI